METNRFVGIGCVVAIFLSIFLFIYTFHFSKGREYNRIAQTKAYEPKECLYAIKTYIEEMKSKKLPVQLNKLNELCGKYEFYYFPENFNDMRRVLIMSKKETLIQLKGFDGSDRQNLVSIGYFVIYGDEFKIKDVDTAQLGKTLSVHYKKNKDYIEAETQKLKEVDKKDDEFIARYFKNAPLVDDGIAGSFFDPNCLSVKPDQIILLKKDISHTKGEK